MNTRPLNHTEMQEHFIRNIAEKVKAGGRVIFNTDAKHLIAVVQLKKQFYILYGASVTRALDEDEAPAKLGQMLFHSFNSEGLIK